MPAPKTIEQKKQEALAKTSTQPVGESKDLSRPRRRTGAFGGLNKKLEVDSRIEGYHLHWLNDVPGRISGALEAGYEHVKEKEVFGYTDSEEFVVRHAGTTEKGDGMATYLMKIREDWYEADQKDVQSLNDKFDDAIRSGKLEAPAHSYGQENIKYLNK